MSSSVKKQKLDHDWTREDSKDQNANSQNGQMTAKSSSWNDLASPETWWGLKGRCH